MKCIEYMRREGIVEMEVVGEVEEVWVVYVNVVVVSILMLVVVLWYMGVNVVNKVCVLLVYVGGFSNYVCKCEDVVVKGYEGFFLMCG